MDRLAAMEAFVRVIEAGSFSGAAKQLRVGQNPLSPKPSHSLKTGSACGCCCDRRTG